MKSVKTTVLFDGTPPVSHLYDANETGDPSTVVTTVPFRKLAVTGRRDTNQSKTVMLSVRKGSAGVWIERLQAAGRPAAEESRKPIVSDGIATQGIKGLHGVGLAVLDKTSMDDVLTVSLAMEGRGEDGGAPSFALPASGFGGAVEILHEPTGRRAPGPSRAGPSTTSRRTP